MHHPHVWKGRFFFLLSGIPNAGTTARVRARHVGFQAQNWAGIGVVLESISSLVAFWRPNPSGLSLLFSVYDARKLLINFAWGARGPGFKSRRPDLSSQRVTDLTSLQDLSLESNWSPKRMGSMGSVWFLMLPMASLSAPITMKIMGCMGTIFRSLVFVARRHGHRPI